MRKEIRMAGYGGQGIVLASVVLGEAAARQGLRSVQTQSYGPESRGGAARGEVVLSDTPIDYPRVMRPDYTICLSQPAYDKYVAGEKETGQVLVDADLVSTAPGATSVPFVRTADEVVGNKITANIIALGYLAGSCNFLSEETLLEAVLKHVPPKTRDLNTKAFETGLSMAKEKTGRGVSERTGSA